MCVPDASGGSWFSVPSEVRCRPALRTRPPAGHIPTIAGRNVHLKSIVVVAVGVEQMWVTVADEFLEGPAAVLVALAEPEDEQTLRPAEDMGVERKRESVHKQMSMGVVLVRRTWEQYTLFQAPFHRESSPVWPVWIAPFALVAGAAPCGRWESRARRSGVNVWLTAVKADRRNGDAVG